MRDKWNHLLRVFNLMSCSMFSCSHFSYFLCDPIGKQSVMSKRGEEATSSEGSLMAKPRPMIPAKAKPVNLVLRSPWSTRENPPQNFGKSGRPRGMSMRDNVVKQTRKLVQTTQSPEVEYSPVRRQERAEHSNPWKQDNREVSSHSPSTRQLCRQHIQERNFEICSSRTINT